MTKDWVEQKLKEDKVKAQETLAKIQDNLSNSILPKELVELTIEALKETTKKPFFSMFLMIKNLNKTAYEDKFFEYIKVFDNNEVLFNKYYDYIVGNASIYNNYLDSEPVQFDGDIVITDPCYITKKTQDEDEVNDWIKCGCGSNMEVLGIKHYMTRDTLYGDWGCTVYNPDTKEKMGEFCADAGLVSVFLLDEIKKYNPAWDYIEKRPWTATLIKDFKGSIWFVIEEETWVYKEDCPYGDYYKKGDVGTDYSVHVVGEGVNKVTGEPIKFYTSQTSL